MNATQSGRSMIEMLGVLAIIGVLSVGGIAGYSKAMMKYKINKTVSQVSQIAQNIRTLYGSQKNYGTILCRYGEDEDAVNCQNLRKTKIIPDELWTSSGGLENAFGGDIEVNLGQGKLQSEDLKAFTIAVYDVPQEACIELSTYNWGNGSSSGLIAIGQGDVSNAIVGCTGNTQYNCADDGVMKVDKAVSNCNTSDGNSIVWKFY